MTFFIMLRSETIRTYGKWHSFLFWMSPFISFGARLCMTIFCMLISATDILLASPFLLFITEFWQSYLLFCISVRSQMRTLLGTQWLLSFKFHLLVYYSWSIVLEITWAFYILEFNEDTQRHTRYFSMRIFLLMLVVFL